MKNTIVKSFAILSLSTLSTLHAAVPLRWTVETSRAQVAQFETYRGETLALEAEMNSYGSPLNTLNPLLYWQTNGMGSAWWTAPATASGNVVRATWSPTNDCGAASYNCFIGSPESTYRAAFRLRMLPSPGFTPNVLRPPATTLDESDPHFRAWVATNEFNAAGVDTSTVYEIIGEFAATGTVQATKLIGKDGRIDGDGNIWRRTDELDWEWSDGLKHRLYGPYYVEMVGKWAWQADGEMVEPNDLTSDPFETLEKAIEAEELEFSGVGLTAKKVIVEIRDRLATEGQVDNALDKKLDAVKEVGVTKLMNLKDVPGISIVPEKGESLLERNRVRIVRVGDEETVAVIPNAEFESILVSDPRRMLFIDRVEVEEGRTNYVVKTFQDYLNAVSPDTMGTVLKDYLPTVGGGTVKGDVVVKGDVTVEGKLSAPSLVRIVTADIEANGFTVSNGVVRAQSGLVVSNSTCLIKTAYVTESIHTGNLKIPSLKAIELGERGRLEATLDVELARVVSNNVERILRGEGEIDDTQYSSASGADAGASAPSHVRLDDGFIRMSDYLKVNGYNPRYPQLMSSSTARVSVTLKNFTENIFNEGTTGTNRLKVWLPLGTKEGLKNASPTIDTHILYCYGSAAPSIEFEDMEDWTVVGDGTADLTAAPGVLKDIHIRQIGTNILYVTTKTLNQVVELPTGD